MKAVREKAIAAQAASATKAVQRAQVALRRLLRNNDGELPLPVTVKGGVTVKKLGHIDLRPGFHNSAYIWPVGYVSTREYNSMRDANLKVLYTSRIIDTGEAPGFVVEAEDDVVAEKDDAEDAVDQTEERTLPNQETRIPTIYSTPSAAWLEILKICNNQKEESQRRKKPSVSGPEMYGLSDPLIKLLVSRLEGFDGCMRYRGPVFDPMPASPGEDEEDEEDEEGEEEDQVRQISKREALAAKRLAEKQARAEAREQERRARKEQKDKEKAEKRRIQAEERKRKRQELAQLKRDQEEKEGGSKKRRRSRSKRAKIEENDEGQSETGTENPSDSILFEEIAVDHEHKIEERCSPSKMDMSPQAPPPHSPPHPSLLAAARSSSSSPALSSPTTSLDGNFIPSYPASRQAPSPNIAAPPSVHAPLSSPSTAFSTSPSVSPASAFSPYKSINHPEKLGTPSEGEPRTPSLNAFGNVPERLHSSSSTQPPPPPSSTIVFPAAPPYVAAQAPPSVDPTHEHQICYAGMHSPLYPPPHPQVTPSSLPFYSVGPPVSYPIPVLSTPPAMTGVSGENLWVSGYNHPPPTSFSAPPSASSVFFPGPNTIAQTYSMSPLLPSVAPVNVFSPYPPSLSDPHIANPRISSDITQAGTTSMTTNNAASSAPVDSMEP